MNVFSALKGTHFLFLFVCTGIYAAPIDFSFIISVDNILWTYRHFSNTFNALPTCLLNIVLEF